MVSSATKNDPFSPTEAGIDAILEGDTTGSFVDSLLSMPDPAAEAGSPGEWAVAVSASLQRKLARELRRAIEDGGRSDDTGARDAA